MASRDGLLEQLPPDTAGSCEDRQLHRGASLSPVLAQTGSSRLTDAGGRFVTPRPARHALPSNERLMNST
jgi:hypothetical protein